MVQGAEVVQGPAHEPFGTAARASIRRGAREAAIGVGVGSRAGAGDERGDEEQGTVHEVLPGG
ncbi:hypothetical protein KBA73_02820 [Patescibacteria group bacterium]|nr:hypothetical protein [Patescibacteria group bacterium]